MVDPRETRSKLLWDALDSISGPIQDSAEVAAIVQLLDAQTTLCGLQWLGRRIARTQLADCDRDALRRVYKENRENILAADPKSPKAASRKQLAAIVRLGGVPLRDMSSKEATKAMLRLKRACERPGS